VPIAPLALLSLLLPWAGAKLLLLACLAAAASARLDRGFVAPASAVRRCLLVVAFAVFVASPYWLIPRSTALRALALALSVLLAVTWSRTGQELRLSGVRAGALASWLVTGLLLAWHAPGLFAPIEFRGDEDLHLVRPLRLLEGLDALGHDHGPAVVTAALLGAFALAALAVRRRAFPLLLSTLTILALALAGLFLRHPPEPELLLRIVRYPVVGAWLQTLAALSPFDALGLPRVIHDEPLYRLVPLLSAFGIGLLALRAARGRAVLRVGAALLVATTPTLTYFSGALYPDLTAAALVSAGLWGIDAALRRARRGRPDRGAAAPLLALGLLTKDSFPPTGLAVAAVAGARGTLAFGAALLAPAFVYLGWRALAERLMLEGIAMRGVGADYSTLANPALYAILLRALAEQFGPLLPLAVLGLVTGWRRSRTRLWVLALLAQLLLFAGDGVGGSAWGRLPHLWCFSRYALTFLPPLVCLALQGLRWLPRRSMPLTAAALLAGLAWNVAARPVALDGSRTPHWGDYVSEPAGERYPYDELYRWLAASGERRTLTIVGRDYTYRDDFYLRKHELQLTVDAPVMPMPRSALVLAGGPDRATLLRAHEAALARAAGAPGLVVLHVSAWLPAEDAPRAYAGLKAVKMLKLGRQALVVYDR
jgi:hypothetical protein